MAGVTLIVSECQDRSPMDLPPSSALQLGTSPGRIEMCPYGSHCLFAHCVHQHLAVKAEELFSRSPGNLEQTIKKPVMDLSTSAA